MNRRLLAVVAGVVALGVGRTAWSWRSAAWDGEAAALRLSDEVDRAVQAGPEHSALGVMGVAPDAELFEQEWVFATYAFAAAGHAQLGLAHPEHAGLMKVRTHRAVDAILQEERWAFDEKQWGDLALTCTRHDHAVLGYLGVAMGMERLLDPETDHAAEHDRIVALLSDHMKRQPILETYPDQAFPVDHAMSIAAVALHAQATGTPVPWLDAHLDGYRRRFVDQDGLLVQMTYGDGRPRSVGRGSGTALAVWALRHADPALSRDLATSVRDGLAMQAHGFHAVREYHPRRCAAGHRCEGDVDSGPLIEGASISATGFSLAAARVIGDEQWFGELWGTTRVFGGWTGSSFKTGGPLGNAIMLAMLTVPMDVPEG
ncbi:MAG: hypothetical protein H6742_20920 [Alphaproteobacteria bacterium]|nr:hypothetical protein [Alphaproteobacteria bacterium]